MATKRIRDLSSTGAIPPAAAVLPLDAAGAESAVQMAATAFFTYHAGANYPRALGLPAALSGTLQKVTVGPAAAVTDLLLAAGLVGVSALAVGNAAAATTPGSVVKKVPVYDLTGALLGYLPVYSAIS